MANARRKYKQVTPERYNNIKTVLNAIPKHSKGLTSLYDTLGIGTGTASSIRNSDNYDDYKRKQREYLQKYEASKVEKKISQTVPQELQDKLQTIADVNSELLLLEIEKLHIKIDKVIEFIELEMDMLDSIDLDDKSMMDRLRERMGV